MNNTRPSEYALPNAGDVVAGKYRVVSVIGTGGMGVVLKAVDTSLGRQVAIKFLAPHKAGRDGAMARFAREARAAASIQSEHVVRVFDVGTLPTGASYIVMEHLVGADLAQTLEARGPLPIEEAVDYVLQACEALGEAHGRGIVHRDLKPQNMYLTRLPSGRAHVKILDFGISKAVEIDEDAPIITLADVVMGTPLYMSPEQMRSLKSVDWRSDIWSLGAILFELLTATPIYDAETTAELCGMIATMPPIPLRRRRPEAPAELEAAILRCLHKDPNGRYQDVARLAEALAPFASERGRISANNVSRVVFASRPRKLSRDAIPPRAGPTAMAVALSGFDTTSDVNDVTKVLVYAMSASAPSSGTLRNAGAHSSFPAIAVSVGPVAPAARDVRDGRDPREVPTTPPRGPATLESWSPGSANPGAMPRSAHSTYAIAVLLGIVAGVVGLGLIGSRGYSVYSKKTSAASAPAPPPAEPKAADLEAEKRIAQDRCSQMQSLLRSNDARSNNQAKQVKGSICVRASGPQATTCDRASCRSACSTLQDKPCLIQLDAAERSFPTHL